VLREQIVILHRRLLAIVRDDEVCRRLMTTPGVGPVVALTYRATVDVPARFRVSRPAGFHHWPLAEPSVRLSPHSAPIRQTCRSYRAANVRKDSRLPGQAFRESDPRGSCELQSA
jgi:hypothetical protein